MIDVQNVLNCFRVLESVAEHQPIGVSRLAGVLEMPRTSVYRCLQALRQAGWLAPSNEESPRWYVTPRALAIARAAPERGLRDAAQPVLQRLRDAADETVFLTIRDGHTAVLIERLDSNRPVRTFLPLHVRVPLHCTANGKAILAHLRSEEIDDLITAGLERYTENTLNDLKSLRAEIVMIRERGYSINVSEWRPEVDGVGAAIHQAGLPIGGVSLSMPASRFREEDIPRYGDLVAKAAAEIGHGLHYP